MKNLSLLLFLAILSSLNIQAKVNSNSFWENDSEYTIKKAMQELRNTYDINDNNNNKLYMSESSAS